MGFSLVDAALALGAVDYRPWASKASAADGYLRAAVARWRRQLEGYSDLDGYPGPDLPGVTEVADWLDAHRPATFTPGILHGDFHLAT